MAIWIGTSGFSYREWKSIFYPSDLASDRFAGLELLRVGGQEELVEGHFLDVHRTVLELGVDGPGGAHHARHVGTALRRVQEPGVVGMAPGIGATMMAPVSVCHQVSTIGQRFLPINV